MLWFFYLSDPFSFSLCAPTQKRRAAFRSPPGDRLCEDQHFPLAVTGFGEAGSPGFGG
jgi:hypothetical protein